jgi:hypothetical protein
MVSEISYPQNLNLEKRDYCFNRSKDWLTDCPSGNAGRMFIFKRLLTYNYKNLKAKKKKAFGRAERPIYQPFSF